MESVHKLLRDEFGYKPALSKDQFFSMGFSERKLIFIIDLIRLTKELRDKLARLSTKHNAVHGHNVVVLLFFFN